MIRVEDRGGGRRGGSTRRVEDRGLFSSRLSRVQAVTSPFQPTTGDFQYPEHGAGFAASPTSGVFC